MLEMIRLPMVNLTPTMRCNLKCRLCGVMVPQYEFRPQMSLTELEETLKAVFEVVDHVDKLQITGGEPLLHPQLSEMLEQCFTYSDQFDKVWLFTNGTVPLQQKLAEVLGEHRDQILVHVSDYGVRRETTEKLLRALEGLGCEYRYLKYYGSGQYAGGWVDQGDFIYHDRSKQELEQVFRSCSHVMRGGSWYVRGGQMHWCGRSARGTELGKIPLKAEDHADLYQGSVQERRERLKRLMKAASITACAYCNGCYGTENASERRPAGEQMK